MEKMYEATIQAPPYTHLMKYQCPVCSSRAKVMGIKDKNHNYFSVRCTFCRNAGPWVKGSPIHAIIMWHTHNKQLREEDI